MRSAGIFASHPSRRTVASINIGVQPDQVPAKAMIAEYAPLLMREAAALKERLV